MDWDIAEGQAEELEELEQQTQVAVEAAGLMLVGLGALAVQVLLLSVIHQAIN
jgi:hypothetical protein